MNFTSEYLRNMSETEMDLGRKELGIPKVIEMGEGLFDGVDEVRLGNAGRP